MPYLIQRVIALLGLIVVGPVVLALAVGVRLTSPGPALHRATRVRPGGTFTLLKLRSMRDGAATSGPRVTVVGDPRVTHLGRLLRRTKLDELPQLWNVVRGDMALVGPRPEDPRYVDLSDPRHALVFGAMPGITGAASLAYRDEEAMLAEAALEAAQAAGHETFSTAELERAYRERVLPAKLDLETEYLANRSWRGDLEILRRTLFER